MMFFRRRSPQKPAAFKRRRFQPTFELLETRALLSCSVLTATPAGASCSFTDSDGALVTVTVRGTAGTATFDDGTGNPVDNGDDISRITIKGANSDFQLIFSSD